MTRLHSELQRLYLLPDPVDRSDPAPVRALVRALVLELARPADWLALSAVWQGVQRDLELPAPAIAVSGRDGLQLWFSLLEPVTADQGQGFLARLRGRYLGDVAAARVRLMTDAGPVPALQPDTGLWSAFVAPDLAPVFAEEPWLDMTPNPDGQAGLLQQVKCILPADFQRALQALDAPEATEAAPPPGPQAADNLAAGPAGPRWARAGSWADPRRFLLDVMNDGTVALALRIEAAKALLPHGGER